jgi:SAM-dependent methyltransferase
MIGPVTLLQSELTHHLDIPAPDAVLRYPLMRIQGWVAYPPDAELESVAILTTAGPVPLGTEARKDVEAALPHRVCRGFTGRIDPRSVLAPGTLAFRFADGTLVERRFPFTMSRESIETFEKAKAEKLARIVPVLRCPACGCGVELSESGAVACRDCRSIFGRGDYGFNFLDEASRERANIFSVDAVSSHDYDPDAAALIDSLSDGLVLDNGSGLRSVYYSNVVNFDVVAYHSTDVIGISETLPFGDGTFDAVISIAALEHIRDPFAAAREIERVLKPGGRVYIAVPFLQPFHGYPNHYYNMTSNGLRNLFPQIEGTVSVPTAGLPIWALSWILNAWVLGLPPEARAQFMSCTVADLMANPMQLVGEPYVRDLTRDANEQLACLNVLQGIKKPEYR